MDHYPKIAATLIGGALALVLTGSAVNAQKGDVGMLRSCMEQAEDTDSCIGLISGPCLDDPANQATAAMANCLRREMVAWDQILNEDYQELLQHLDAEQADAIRDVQRSWIAFRDLDCGFHHILIRGTMAQFTEASCLASHTAKRVFAIRSYRGQAGP